MTLLYVLIGAVATATADLCLGIDFKGRSFWRQLLHKIVYMAWGAALLSLR